MPHVQNTTNRATLIGLLNRDEEKKKKKRGTKSSLTDVTLIELLSIANDVRGENEKRAAQRTRSNLAACARQIEGSKEQIYTRRMREGERGGRK